MKTAEIRKRFLEFFKKHDHTVVESSSLIPHNDPTLLFTNAGMVQFKDVFTGKEKKNFKRATTVQKCVRAGGKHNDLENVGFTARHHTFFEMLGNFSFGDYFKKEAIRYGWTFVTEELGIGKDRLYVSVHRDDDEAADIWAKDIGIARDRIYRFNEDNFWAMGDTGPCGPCSEIFVDRGEKYGCKKPGCEVGCECDRFIEIWNLVFMQYERDEKGSLTPLPRPSVDTGAGLERMASVIQDVDSNYDIDSFVDILKKTAALLDKKYEAGTQSAFPYRVIADHARATTFLIGDGVMPSNEGRGYVLRRIMRRAIRYGKNIGFSEPFLYKVCGYVIDQMQEAYPYVLNQRKLIEKVVVSEEELFLKTLERGLTLLDEELSSAKTVLSGEVAFKLYDTYGFPLDLTKIICKEKNISIDEKGFENAMSRQKEMSRQSWKGGEVDSNTKFFSELEQTLAANGDWPEFAGYDSFELESKLVSLMIKIEGQMVAAKEYDCVGKPEGTELCLIFKKTPFYGESGGQTGDRGWIEGNGFMGEVIDVQKPSGPITMAVVRPKHGTIIKGNIYKQKVNRHIRELTAKNHTATHMLHWALRSVLGTHVKQSGSLVSPDMLRFDFSHFTAVTPEELWSVEKMVNEKIWSSQKVNTDVTTKDAAINSGAIAFFGEKYGDEVRVVHVGDFSTELCGGSHVAMTSEINLFKIISESSIASGVRRIIAYTSKTAFDYLQEKDEESKHVRDKFKSASTDDLLNKIEKLFNTEKSLRKEVEQLKSKNLGSRIDEMIDSAREILGYPVISQMVDFDSTGIKKLREVADRLKQKRSSAIIVLGMSDMESGKAYILAARGKEAPKNINSNEIINGLAHLIGGKGGGNPDMAQAGGSNPGGIKEALGQVFSLVEKTFKN
ncbi:MAG: alanine--tRNA ligase [Oligoflexales bacterium]|nr:alanine--tRNA ligase [Oligoflexales bacterium]